MASTFGQRLRAARVMAGLSMDGLVERIGRLVTKQAISKYENGLMLPDSEVVIALATALGLGVDYFFTEPQTELEELSFRKKASLGKKEVESLKERVRDEVDRYLQLEALLHIDSVFVDPFPPSLIADAEGIEAMAGGLRQAWGLGLDAAVSHVVSLLEERSVKVMELDEVEGFDGLSGRVDSIPFIILNKKAPTDRRRLTALHEFAHLCLTFDTTLDEKAVEKICHGFGGAFLLPAKVLKRELGAARDSVSLFELLSLKKRYGISMQAIMYRARRHGIIGEYSYERFIKDMGARGWRKNEPGEYCVSESPERFKLLLHRALAEKTISISKAAYLSRASLGDIEREFSLRDEAHHP